MNKYVRINLTMLLQWGVVWPCLSVMDFGSHIKYQASQETVYIPVSTLYLTTRQPGQVNCDFTLLICIAYRIIQV